MTRDEQRQAWRVYAAALLAGDDVDLQAVVKAADWMVQEERKRFDSPDHSGGVTKMVEPRPWVDLTQDEILKLAGSWVERRHHPRELSAAVDLIKLVKEMLRVKNGGTR
jgi:hypothetical protein